MFCSDDPCGAANCLWIWRFPALDALAVASALPVPFLLARCRRPVSLLRLPPRPFPRRLPAPFAAISLARLPGMKALLTSFQQTTPRTRPACQSFPAAGPFFFGMLARSVGSASVRQKNLQSDYDNSTLDVLVVK